MISADETFFFFLFFFLIEVITFDFCDGSSRVRKEGVAAPGVTHPGLPPACPPLACAGALLQPGTFNLIVLIFFIHQEASENGSTAAQHFLP